MPACSGISLAAIASILSLCLGVPAAAGQAAAARLTLPTGIEMRYLERGPADGEVVVFLHGFTDTSRSFLPTIDALLERNPRIRALAPDLRGHGGSSLPPAEECAPAPERCFRVPDFARDVIAFLDALEIERAHLVGHSLGSMVAQVVALEAPERIASLTLIGSTARATGNPGIVDFILGQVVEGMWKPALEAQGLAWPTDAYRRTPLDADPEAETWLAENWVTEIAADPAYLAEIVAETARTPIGTWLGVGRGVLEFDNVARLGGLAVPTLVLWATQDGLLPESDQVALRAALDPASAGCKARYVWKAYGKQPLDASGLQTSDLGHNFQWGAPAAVAEDIAAWLDHGTPTPDLYYADPADPRRIRTDPGAAALLAGPACVTAGDAQATPIDLDEARRAFAAAKSASDRDAGRLWGVELYGPVFLVDPGSRFVVADRADPEGVLAERGGVWVGALPEQLNPANTAIDWSGLRWTMVLWPTPSVPHARNRLLLHEMFHRVQDAVGLPANNPVNVHLDSRDGRSWMRLEMRALAAALVADRGGRAEAIADALAFAAERRGLFPPAAAEEDALERNEGMAEYTGLVLGGLPAEVLADRAAVALEQREGSESLSRSFAYATGPAYGVLLDASGAPWRERLLAGGSLRDLLAQAYPVEPVAAVDARLAPYNGEWVIATEAAREVERLAREAELRGRFVDGPVVRMAPGEDFRFSFDPNEAVGLEGVGTVYESARVVDGWGILEVASGGALFLRDDRGWITGVVVPALAGSPDPPAAGEGWTLELAEGWEIAPGQRPGDWLVRPTAGASGTP
jgi:pimeloyl-ACP methyl ester carboxylesterase